MNPRAFTITVLLLPCFGVKTHADELWNVRNSPVSQRLNSVFPGNGVFVAAGSGPTVLTSSDGVNWEQSPTPAGVPNFFSGAYVSGPHWRPYVLGGEKGGLTCFSTNAASWNPALSTTGNERILGLTFAYGQFVAVGTDNNGAGYILTSPDGLNWTPQSVPTTNGLFAVAPAMGANGTGWTDLFLVAVGERGTILTSTDGIVWVPRSSGTTAALRAIAFNGGLFLVGGDHGVMLMSSDGVTWTRASSASFDIRGLACSGTNVVAVGSYGAAGRLQVSPDGLSWPGTSSEFPRVLFSVAYKQGTYVAVGDAGLIVQAGSGAPGNVNKWVKPGSGDWQDQTAWSLGVLPAADQTIMITNQGWKAVAIGPATSKNFPQSLDVASVTLGGYTDSFNVLLLNYAGFEVPLTAGTISVGTNSGITALGSVLNVSTNFGTGALTNESSVNQGDSAMVTANSLQIGTMNAAGVYNLTNGSLSAQQVVLGTVVPVPPFGGDPSPFNPSTAFNQFGGSVALNLLRLDGGNYRLSDGTLGAGAIQVRRGSFQQTGGSVTGALGVGLGSYLLSGGILRQQSLELPSFGLFTGSVLGATFLQTGGTNYCDGLSIWNDPGSPASPAYGAGHFVLSNGVLYVSNVTYSHPGGDFQQWGGLHTNAGTAVLGESVAPGHNKNLARHALGGGTLLTPSIDIRYGTFTQTGGTNLVAGHVAIGELLATFNLSGGLLCDSNTTVETSGYGYGDLSAFFVQSGGIHVVTNLLSVSADGVTYAGPASYTLNDGQLTVGALQLAGGGGTFHHDGGTFAVGGLFTLASGIWDERTAGQQFGRLLLSAVGGTNSVLQLPAGPCQLRFADSSGLAWSSNARLLIRGWYGLATGGGQHQVIFGFNSSALTPQQLGLIQFQNPAGTTGTFPARILATGEIVPDQGLALQRTSSGMTLSWSSGTLQSATNIAGPFQDVSSAITSPYNVPMTHPQEFFRVRP